MQDISINELKRKEQCILIMRNYFKAIKVIGTFCYMLGAWQLLVRLCWGDQLVWLRRCSPHLTAQYEALCGIMKACAFHYNITSLPLYEPSAKQEAEFSHHSLGIKKIKHWFVAWSCFLKTWLWKVTCVAISLESAKQQRHDCIQTQ